MTYLMAGHCVTVLMAHQISQADSCRGGAGMIFTIEILENIFRKVYQIYMGDFLVEQILILMELSNIFNLFSHLLI